MARFIQGDYREMKVKIRELTLKELDKDLRPLDWIMQMHHALIGSSRADVWERRVEIMKRAYKTGMYGMIVALDNTDSIIGFLDYWIIYCPIEGFPIAFLQNMRVIDYHQGKGIGTLLVRKLRDIARKKKCGEIHVMAGQPADKFYLKCGFQYKPSDIYMEASIEQLFGGK